MYRAREKQMSIYDYLPPYHGELCNANRWVRLAAAIDWDGFEKAYSALFAPGGKVALPPAWRWAAGSSSCTMRRRTARSWRWCRKAPTCNIFWGSESFTDAVPFSSRTVARFRARIPDKAVRRRSACCAAFSDPFI